jgi:hypothetical protein
MSVMLGFYSIVVSTVFEVVEGSVCSPLGSPITTTNESHKPQEAAIAPGALQFVPKNSVANGILQNDPKPRIVGGQDAGEDEYDFFGKYHFVASNCCFHYWNVVGTMISRSVYTGQF